MNNKTISEFKEKKLIDLLLEQRDKQLTTINPLLLQSYHDDAAIEENKEKYTILTTDMLIQSTHFPKEMTYYQMGQKSVIVNISDILAMNATPKTILMSLGLPKSMKIKDFKELINGILDTCKKYNVTLIGGDINTHNQIIISITATGQSSKNIKLQKGIKENDLIAITGNIGSPKAAIELLKNKEKYNDITQQDKNKIIKTLLKPTIPFNKAKKLQKLSNTITSMTDITDGLASELGQLQKQNPNIGFNIKRNKIPYNPTIEVIAKKTNTPLEEYLYHFGEEFELLLTLNPKKYKEYKKSFPEIYIIGKVTKTGKIIEETKTNKKIINPVGYEHI